jgi:glucose/mannose-6-phosphate isomerase
MFSVNLDNEKIYQLDSGGVYGSILALPAQFRASFAEALSFSFPNLYKQADKVVIAGMGGSGLGARVLNSLYKDQLSVPVELVTDYHLPAYVDSKTLVILSSYSGTTEETLSCARETTQRKAMGVVLATGGELADYGMRMGWPVILLDGSLNPSRQPRMAIGLNFGSLLGIFSRLGFLSVDERETEAFVMELLRYQKSSLKEIPAKQNAAKTLAIKMVNKAAVIVASQHLYGAGYVFKNQLNENAKVMANIYEVPEMNHHALEGLSSPKNIKDKVHFILLDSGNYEQSKSKRMVLTEEVIGKQGFSSTRLRGEAESPLLEVLETIQFGAFVSFYLALLYKIDPTPIPWVDYFKKRLSSNQ